MDQGIAAVLGAVVGAVAAGGGTYLTAKSSERLHKRQARREAYAGFLQDIASLESRLGQARALMNLEPTQREAFDFSVRLAEIQDLQQSLERRTAAVTLEGPDALAFHATLAAVAAHKLQALMEIHVVEYATCPVPQSEREQVAALNLQLSGNLAEVQVRARRYV